MDHLIRNVVTELNNQFAGEHKVKRVFYVHETKKYYKILVRLSNQFMDEGEIYCFIAKTGFNNRTLGQVIPGDIFKPRSFEEPAKYARGNLFRKNTWDCLGKWGVAHKSNNGTQRKIREGALQI